ncbi:MAG: LamG domain-containing protein [Bacteroidota bacterium]|nr:LamG domain-containing protein [Bacteroidota bacterium]
MNLIKKISQTAFTVLVLAMVITSCQKLDRPALGAYPQDANPPGGPLKFYTAFDGTTSNPLMNGVDSIRANFPSVNPFTQIAGISGKAVQGDGTKIIQYASANDFVSTASSFSISFWEKRNGAPQGNASFAFHLASSNGYWTGGSSMFCLFDWGTVNDSAIIKVDVVDAKMADNWFQWVKNSSTDDQRVYKIMDNNWHHIVFVYDATTSKLTLYVDGTANPHQQSWGTHGAANMDASKITGLDIGGNRHVKDMGWGMQWDGGLDQFRMYSKALSASEITALYNGKM